jgi:hypothetical protein
MSSKWVSRMHGFMPLNEQERKLKDLLEKLQFSYRTHEVFPFAGRSLVVDSFLPELDLVVECWMSESRQGTALTWLERNAAFIDVKFTRLKLLDSRLRCLGLVQAPQADPVSLKQVVGSMMGHADFMVYSFDELERILQNLAGMKT